MSHAPPIRRALALALVLAATSCARRRAQADPPPNDPESAEPASEVAAEAVTAPAPREGPIGDPQMLAFFDALGDLMVRDLLAWAATDFQTRSEAKAEFDAVLDKSGARSQARMQSAAKRVGIEPSEIVDFVSNHVTDYVRLAEQSTFGDKVRRALEGPEVAAQLQRIERLPEGAGPATSDADPGQLCKTMQSLAVEAGEKTDDEALRDCAAMMGEMRRVDPIAYDKMSACITGSRTMAVAVECIERIEPSGG